MESARTLQWLRDSGVEGLTGILWILSDLEARHRRIQIAHADPDCRNLRENLREERTAELEDLLLQEITICHCIYSRLENSEKDKVHLNVARIRISLERLESLLNDGTVDDNGRYPHARGAVVATGYQYEAQRWARETVPPQLEPAQRRLEAEWEQAVTAHPVDWEAFDVETVRRAADLLTRRSIWEEVCVPADPDWQILQSVAATWMGLDETFTRRAADRIEAKDPDTLQRFAAWDSLLTENLADQGQRALYVASFERDPAMSLPNLRPLIVHRGLKTQAAGRGFAVLPNVVARSLATRGCWGEIQGQEAGGAVQLLDPDLPTMSDLAWQTALLLWEESFENRDDPGPYREFADAIEAAANL